MKAEALNSNQPMKGLKVQICKRNIDQIKEFKTVEVGPLAEMPEKVLQFGEGNFLRAFVDWIFNAPNARVNFNGKVVIVQPLQEGLVDLLNQQDELYTVLPARYRKWRNLIILYTIFYILFLLRIISLILTLKSYLKYHNN